MFGWKYRPAEDLDVLRPEGKATLFDLTPCARCGRPAYGYGKRTYCPGCAKRRRRWGPGLFLVLILLGTLAASLTAPYWLPVVTGPAKASAVEPNAYGERRVALHSVLATG